MIDSHSILDKVKSAVGSIEPEASLILFGSRSRGQEREDSDWDFLVLVDGAVNSVRTDRIRHALYEIEWATGQVISSIVRSRSVWTEHGRRGVPLNRAIERDGVLL